MSDVRTMGTIARLNASLAERYTVERFLAEIKTTAKLQHPHILPLLDSGDADGLVCYVMPLMDGETLRSRVERERQLPVDDAIRIATETASALDNAHRHGVIHRDIKPEISFCTMDAPSSPTLASRSL